METETKRKHGGHEDGPEGGNKPPLPWSLQGLAAARKTSSLRFFDQDGLPGTLREGARLTFSPENGSLCTDLSHASSHVLSWPWL